MIFLLFFCGGPYSTLELVGRCSICYCEASSRSNAVRSPKSKQLKGVMRVDDCHITDLASWPFFDARLVVLFKSQLKRDFAGIMVLINSF